MKTFKRLSEKDKAAVKNEIKLMLAAHRDCLWNRWTTCSSPQAVDPSQVQLVCNEGYYGEAFGIVRALTSLRYGYLGPDNIDAIQDGRSTVPEHNVKWFFQQILREYLDEEGFYDKSCSEDRCKVLLNKYRNLVRK